MKPPLVQLTEPALPEALFRRLLRRVRALRHERLRTTYQTTFWRPLDAGLPENVVDEAILHLRPLLPPGVVGVEWWLSRMYATDVRVDFHRDRDERRALAGGRDVHPTLSSVLFLNRVRGGALAVTEEPPDPRNPSLAPANLDLVLVAPRPNRYVRFDGRLTHGVLDVDNQVPDGKKPGPARLRLSIAMNGWARRPTDVPTWGEARAYRSLGLSPAPSRRGSG